MLQLIARDANQPIVPIVSVALSQWLLKRIWQKFLLVHLQYLRFVKLQYVV
jgi:hypothetical protein